MVEQCDTITIRSAASHKQKAPRDFSSGALKVATCWSVIQGMRNSTGPPEQEA
jgi:hypothetical protein